MKPGSEVSLSNINALFGGNAAAVRDGERKPPPVVKKSDDDDDDDVEREDLKMQSASSTPIPTAFTNREERPTSAAPSPPPQVPPLRYGERAVGGWRPRHQADFGDGGAFPEVHVVQLPRGLGWGASSSSDASSSSSPNANAANNATASPASLKCSFDDLQTKAARVMLRLDDDDDNDDNDDGGGGSGGGGSGGRQRRMTAEYASFVRFASGVLSQSKTRKLESDDVVAALLASHPNARPIERVSNLDPAVVGERYLQSTRGGRGGEGGGDGDGDGGDENKHPTAAGAAGAAAAARVGTPVVVTDGSKGWERGLAWGLEGLAKRYGGCVVRCNDRAPARHADARELGREWERECRGRESGSRGREEEEEEGSVAVAVAAASDSPPPPPPPPRQWGGAQRSCAIPLREFIRYVASRPGCDDPAGLRLADAPFYCNGWRAFEPNLGGGVNGHDGDDDDESDHAATTMTSAFPPPYFTSQVDHTRDITRQTHRALLSSAPPAAAEVVADSLDATLSKIFAGPAGTVTRLHQDAGDAHAWLGQARGRKLFVCYPPDDTHNLYIIKGETETVQSAVDPLATRNSSSSSSSSGAGGGDDQPLYWAAARPVVFVLEPGEVVLVPRGWWHYAAALDSSITVMRNFYHAGTNAEALVRTIIAKARGAVAMSRG